jgi:hypothetical protein
VNVCWRTHSICSVAALFQQLDADLAADTALTCDSSLVGRGVLRSVFASSWKGICEGSLAGEAGAHYDAENAPESQHGDEGS